VEFVAVVEVPKGSRNKYEMDHATGRIRLDRQLFTSTRYPADYGFIPGTLGEDGDPLDVLVLLDEPTFPGCEVDCRPLGIFRMRDEKGSDAKILAVATWDRRSGWTNLRQVPELVLHEIAHFFQIYKDLETGKSTSVEGWQGRAAAEAEIRRARKRHQKDGAGLMV
jgi:inorganic pyrophosphatase